MTLLSNSQNVLDHHSHTKVYIMRGMLYCTNIIKLQDSYGNVPFSFVLDAIGLFSFIHIQQRS